MKALLRNYVNGSDGSRVERTTSVADRRASALSAAGVANGFSNLIDGKPSISVKWGRQSLRRGAACLPCME